MSKVYGILLTDEAWEALADPLAPYTTTGPDGRYIYCQNVQQHGPFFVFEASCKNPTGSTFEAEISIPHRFVQMVASAAEKSQIGFMSTGR